MRKTVITTLLIVLSVIVIWVVAVRRLEHRIIYFPGPQPVQTPEVIGLEFEEVRFQSADGETLSGWWIPAPETGVPPLLFFHGNAGSREDRLEILSGMHRAGIPVFIIDYRGFGGSSGVQSEAGLRLDGEAAFDWLNARTGGAPIVQFGSSLGGGVAVHTALTRPAAGLVLESAFTSIPEMAKRTIPLPLPLLRILVKTKFNNGEALKQVTMPLLVIHGDQDEVVPFRMGQALYQAAASPDKRFHQVDGAHHNDTFIVGGGKYWELLRTFVKRMGGAGIAPGADSPKGADPKQRAAD